MSKIEEVRNQKHTIPWLNLPWYEVYDTIAALRQPFATKALLWNIARHTNKNPEHPRYGRAWLSQDKIAGELGCGVATVKRAFAAAKAAGLVEVERQKKGKGKIEQYNEYWLEGRVFDQAGIISTDQDDLSSGEQESSSTDQVEGKQGSNSDEQGSDRKGAGIKIAVSTDHGDPEGLDLGSKGGAKKGFNEGSSPARASHSNPSLQTNTKGKPVSASAAKPNGIHPDSASPPPPKDAATPRPVWTPVTCPSCGTLNRFKFERSGEYELRCGKCHEVTEATITITQKEAA